MTLHLYQIPGTLTRVPDGWCPTCHLPSLWEGPVWVLGPDGVDRWGWITGCYDENWWVRVPKKQP